MMEQERDSIFPKALQRRATERVEEILLRELGTERSALPKGISAATAATVIGAKEYGGYITAEQHRETSKYHGILWVNHPTPSGTPRLIMAVSDHRGYETRELAVERFIGIWPEELGHFKIHIGSGET